jgi:DNA-binding XRE family transcriptional regulator
MEAQELAKIRVYLGKTQRELASLLGTSIKAVQSFEQGWRNIPPYVERQVLFLLSLASRSDENSKACWQVRKCTGAMRQNCPAFQYEEGKLCWLANGTICRGRDAGSWPRKMTECRKCPVFQACMPGGVLDRLP